MLNEGSFASDEPENSLQQTRGEERRQIQQVANGDEIAFERLYNRHNLKVYNYILRLIHEQSVAEDLLQETFIAVWNGAPRFRGQSSVKTWIFRIAHNQAVSWLRKHARLEFVEENQIPASEWQGDENLMVEWQVEQIGKALDKLSPTHRAVIELVFEQELSYAEIARVMDCPIGTVKSRMSYALKNLNQLLKQSE